MVQELADWAGPDSPLASVVRAQSEDCLSVYARDARRVDEDLATEISTAEGGYGRKQIFELVQNGADALRGQPGRIEMLLTADTLYVANQGVPFTESGIHAIMAARLAEKRADEIGRFGLGFKSVVAISDAPKVFSRTVSFGFNREISARLIRDVVPRRSHNPVLRLAEPLDPRADAAQDPALAELMEWATTIVKLPLKDGDGIRDMIGEDLRSFPSEFLLFSPHVEQLRLTDVTKQESREIELHGTDGSTLLLTDAGSTTRWRVVSAVHVPTPKAAKDAGELARRDQIQIQWAVPLQSRSRDGSLWAFFPTQERTTLTGIVNAPWKMSDDRRSLIEGDFNEELLTRVLPQLITTALPGLADAQDPAAVLDLLPARGRESRGWADEVINEPVFAALRRGTPLPATDGAFRSPRDLVLAPKGLGEDLLTAWTEHETDLTRWVHPAVERTPERRLKAERLMSEGGHVAGVREWLEALCLPGTLESSANAIAMTARVIRERVELEQEARSSRVLMLEDGSLAAPRPGTVFVRSSADERGFAFIQPALVDIPGVPEALHALGIRVLDRGGELRNALSGSPIDWSRVWSLATAVPIDTAEEILTESLPEPLTSSVQVRSAAGRWVPISAAFLAGQVIPADGSRDRELLIDPRYHGASEELLVRLGAVQKPMTRPDALDERWLRSYRELLIDTFIRRAEQSGRSRPNRDRVVTEGIKPPWPMESLPRLSDAGRAEMTTVALQLDSGGKWQARHSTNRSYGRTTAEAPTTWWLKRHGRVKTALGPWPIGEALAPAEGLPEDVLPVADVGADVANRLGLLTHPKDLSQESWTRILQVVATWTDERRRTTAYSWAVHFADVPKSIRVGSGANLRELPPAKVAVSQDKSEYEALVQQRLPVVLIEDGDDKQAFMRLWGLADGAAMLRKELVADVAGEAAPLLDFFPGLRLYLERDQTSLKLQPCRSLTLVTATPGGQMSQAVSGHLDGDVLLVTATGDAERLAQVSHALDLGLDSEAIHTILTRQVAERVRTLKATIRRAASDEERLVLAVGAEELRASIPEPALQAVAAERRRDLTEIELAEMAIAVHGLSVLRQFRDVLAGRNLNPPQQWAGRAAARRFVSELGFPTDYAGFPSDRPPAVFAVDGPAVLPELHDFQSHVTAKIKELVRGQRDPRGMVSLPTGAGKTRVAVQALIEEVRDGHLDGSVVWIAQSEELCEQAVQSWAYVWRALGPERRLVVGRFWSTNDVTEEPEDFQLVVATPDKLRTIVDNEDYRWLTEAPVVVVDEAHRSIAPEYTRVLNWLGRAPRTGQGRPLLGLTATPFRNVNEEETKRLAARYGGQRLDEGAFEGDPYQILQHRTVLARVDHELLPGVDVALSQLDQDLIKRMRHVPAHVEERLGASIERNRRIVDSIAELPADWTILLFATSVENSRALAAQLSVRGIPAVSISGDTETAARRRYVEQFKEGRIRVVTNYNVLTQGFDAPAVRAVYVTRPTFSANLYQQMIGRGLRGPLNGGSEEVLIVNVKDNFEAYGEQLAFYHFDHLWGGGKHLGA